MFGVMRKYKISSQKLSDQYDNIRKDETRYQSLKNVALDEITFLQEERQRWYNEWAKKKTL